MCCIVREKQKISERVVAGLGSWPLEPVDTRMFAFDLKRMARDQDKNSEETRKQQCQIEASPLAVELTDRHRMCVCIRWCKLRSITSCVRCNTCVTYNGTREQAKNASMYTSKYKSKVPTSLNHAIPILHATHEQNKKRTSRADDAGTDERDFKFVMDQVTNLFTCGSEWHDTQVAGKLLGIKSEYNSHKPWYFGFHVLCMRLLRGGTFCRAALYDRRSPKLVFGDSLTSELRMTTRLVNPRVPTYATHFGL